MSAKILRVPRRKAAGALTIAAGLAAAVPIAAVAQAASTPSPGATAAPAAAAPAVAPATLSLHQKRLSVRVGRSAFVSGLVRPVAAHRSIQLLAHSGRKWHRIAGSQTDAQGRFKLTYRTRHPGSSPVQVRLIDASGTGARRTAGRLQVFRPTVASTYSGGSTACGPSSSGLGVANKSLPCGTMVSFQYHGRSIRVPVIDRGPYVGGREWDLTDATASRLHFSGVGTVYSTK